MMRILTAEEMKKADAAAFADDLPSRAVMEVAGRAVAALALDLFELEVGSGVVVLCGAGNNGGDGYVLARALHLQGLEVQTWSLAAEASLSPECRAAAESYRRFGGESHFLSAEDPSSVEEILARCRLADCVVDALFGTGVKGALREPYATLVDGLNLLRCESSLAVIAIDVPSGVDASSAKVAGTAVVADCTAALQAVKPAHVQAPASDYVGELWCLEIGIATKEFCQPPRKLLHLDSVLTFADELLHFEADMHKGSRGRIQILGGSPGYFGAPRLSAEAAARAGAGLVEMLLPRAAAREVGPHCGALLCTALASDETGNLSVAAADSISQELERGDVLVVGPGMGVGEGAQAVLAAALRQATQVGMPLVIDADALTVLARRAELRELLSSDMLLTPHPGEMARLLNVESKEIQSDRFAAVSRAAADYRCWVLLKGAYSLLSAPDGRLWVSPFAEPSLATAGSGDVLAGILAALRLRDVCWDSAAPLALYAHGLIGQVIGSSKEGVFGGYAERILSHIPEVLSFLADAPARPSSFLRQVVPPPLPEELMDRLEE